jgi:signal transduction histidine kinase
MTIRTRLAVWYAGLSLVSLSALGYGLYFELVKEPLKASQSGGKIDSPQQAIIEILLWYTIPTALVSIGTAWWMTRRLFSPIARLTEMAEKITLDNLDQRLPEGPRNDEFARLAEVFNNMLARLESSVSQIRDFTIHASHELKTPLTIMRGEMETALHDSDITPAQRELFASQLDEVQRLTKIVEGLTLLAKADAGQLVLEEDVVPFSELVRDSFADAQILAQARNIQVVLAACDDVTMRGDRHRLRQLLLNLTDNAIKYNEAGGTVEIALRRGKATAELTISNTGRGISPEFLPRVFERFFRGDPEQTANVEGCGLGLALAEWIVHAHGGQIELTSTPGSWTTVHVDFPMKLTERPARTTRLLKPLPRNLRLAKATTARAR